MSTTVIYHGGCADGFTAAWVARMVHPDADFVPAKYGDEPPEVTGRQVYVLDFCYDEQTLLDMGERAQSLVVLDHHKSAFERVGHLECCEFDMTRSGARMAWDHFYPKGMVPDIVRYVEDRDLWQWKLGGSREINAVIQSTPMEWKEWDALQVKLQNRSDVVASIGAGILRYQEQQVERICRNARTVDFAGHSVPAVNTCTQQSEAGNARTVRGLAPATQHPIQLIPPLAWVWVALLCLLLAAATCGDVEREPGDGTVEVTGAR